EGAPEVQARGGAERDDAMEARPAMPEIGVDQHPAHAVPDVVDGVRPALLPDVVDGCGEILLPEDVEVAARRPSPGRIRVIRVARPAQGEGPRLAALT